jgi:formiminoglutamate deiminase
MVGEFHYLHHDKHGVPYSNRTETSDVMIQAAKDVGVRICLIRTGYMRGGFQQELTPAQARFSDRDVDNVLRDVDHLRKQYADDGMVTIALAAHSIRAVPLAALRTLATYAAEHELPFHMHVCEQRRELEECRAEYNTTPIALLESQHILSPRFVAVHATHLQPEEIEALGQQQAFVCICRTTERDLGDGLPPASELMQAGARLCVGVDSHTSPDAFEEIRAVENDERSRLESRHAVAEAPALLDAATSNGYAALGFSAIGDIVKLAVDDAALVGLPDELAPDAIIFGATPRAVRVVHINGTQIVANGLHIDYATIRENYLKTLRQLNL